MKKSELRVMPPHNWTDSPEADAMGEPWRGESVACKGASVPGYVHEIDSTHWHCNSCGFVAEVEES